MEGQMGYAEIDAGRCKGCELCVTACPRDLIHLADEINPHGHYPVRAERTNSAGQGCTGCAACGMMCPETAITVYREKEG